jgi:hypothetical protein
VNGSPRPNFFIIGAPKCGTTSLYEYLKGHPQVYMSAAKEPGYFAPDNLLPGSHELRHGTDEPRYLALFADAEVATRIGEATVGYIFSEQAPGLLHEFDPQARIIAMFRNPVEMIHSLHNQRLSEGREQNADFGEAIAAEEQVDGEQPPEDVRRRMGAYRDRGLFSQYLSRWRDVFGPEQVHVVILEDMEREPEREFRRVLEFLGVDPDYAPESFRVHNPRHQPRSRLLRSLLKSRPPQWFVWTLLPRLVGDTNTRRLVRRFRHSRLNRRPAPRAAMDAGLRRKLEDYYAADVARLGEILGRDVGQLWFGRSSAGK